ncbi:MAG: hypothetical protein WBP11_06540 [Dokdonella sp.]
MATEPQAAGNNPESEKPDPPIRHQQGRINPSDEDPSAADSASQQQQ